LKYSFYFESSGTSNQNKSRHYIYDKDQYLKNIDLAFKHFYGDISKYHLLALLPNYLEQKHSSLIFMIDHLMQQSKNTKDYYFLNDYEKLIQTIEKLKAKKAKIILFGVSFALWEMAEKYQIDLSDAIIFETGGMKGRRKEITRDELHTILNKSFNSKTIHSEYGMCELLSQSYSKGNGIFYPAPSKKIIIKETNDPLANVSFNTTGRINVIDLANEYSCAFIETSDIGKQYQDGSFEVLGRLDNSALRGCNLFY